MDAKKREFFDLVQGGMTVDEYELEFVRLSQHALGVDSLREGSMIKVSVWTKSRHSSISGSAEH